MPYLPLLSTSTSSCSSYFITIPPPPPLPPPIPPITTPYALSLLQILNFSFFTLCNINSIQFNSKRIIDGPILACESLLLSCVLCALCIDRVAASGAFEFIINLSRTFSGVQIVYETLFTSFCLIFSSTLSLSFFHSLPHSPTPSLHLLSC